MIQRIQQSYKQEAIPARDEAWEELNTEHFKGMLRFPGPLNLVMVHGKGKLASCSFGVCKDNIPELIELLTELAKD